MLRPKRALPDEHPLLKFDFDLAKRYFEVVDKKFFGLTTLLSVPVRDTKLGDALLGVTAAIDGLLFQSPIRWLAWYVMFELR